MATAGYSEVGQNDLRSLVTDKEVQGFAMASYKFKQVVTISPTSAWKNDFIQEDPSVLDGQAGGAIEGVPRGAEIPNVDKAWTRARAVITKFAAQSKIIWEDILSDDVDVETRTAERVGEAIAKKVDDRIWIGLGGTGTAYGINSFAITGRGWDESSGTIIDDLGKATMLIAQNNYPTERLVCLISPKDKRSVMNYVAEKGSQFPELGTRAALNGYIGTLAGVDFIVSNSVTASNALVVVPQKCATWKELVPLKSTRIEDPYVSLTIRAVEEGSLQLTNPKAVCLIIGTQKNAT